MKGYRKKLKAKRMLAAFLTALMVLTICMPQTVSAASADDRYTGGTTIADILTNYQYFIQNDASLKNHTVGAVAVGGSLAALNTIGDGAQSPSYAEKINEATIGNGAGYGATTRDFYYNTGASTLPQAGFTQNANFFANQGGIDGIFGSTSSGLIAESISLATQATEVYTCDENSSMGYPVIDITLKAQNMNIEIPYEEFKKAKAINLNIADIDNFSKYAYTINIIGVGSQSITLDGEAWKGAADSNSTDVWVNGKQYAFLGDMSGQVHGIECNLSGMKLMWNFPDAVDNTIYWNAMGGHLVAPRAGVEVTSGRFQGGIIAKGFDGTGESHYYPYNAVSGTPQDLVITKKFVKEDGTPAEVTTGSAIFGLYTDSACATTPIATASATDIDAATGIGTVRFESETIPEVVNNGTYYIKEISAPDGFSINKTIYACQVSDGGLITYCEYGKDTNPVYSSASPVCENLVDKTTDSTGVLTVYVEDKDTRERIENIQITVKDPNGNVVDLDNNPNTTTDTFTNKEGMITFTGLEKGDYTVTIGKIPEGYQTPTEYHVEVEVKETGYHLFELEQVKEPITINFVDTKGNPIEVGGWVTVQNTSDKDDKGELVYDAMSAWITTGGTTTFKNNLSATYAVSLMKDKETGKYILPEGYALADTDLNGKAQDGTATIIVSATDGTDNNSHTFVFEKQVGSVEVTVKDKTSTDPIPNATVEITYPDGTTEEKTTDGTGKVTYTDVPVGDVKVEIIGAPGYVIPTDGTEEKDPLTVEKNTTATHTFELEKLPEDAKGDLTITITTPSDSTNTTTGVDITVTDSEGDVVAEYTDKKVNDTIELKGLAAGTYTVELKDTPGEDWKTTSKEIQVVNVPKDGEGTAEYVLVPYGDLKITVQETGTATPVTGANVTVKNSNNEVVYNEKTTGTDITIKDLPVGNYTVTVTPPFNSNYKESSVTANPTPSVTVGSETPVVLELTPIRNLTVTVVDADNEAIKIPGVEFSTKVTKEGSNTQEEYYGSTTESNGSAVLTDVPVGEYEVTITSVPTDSGYEIKDEVGYNSTIATVTASQDGTAVLKLVKTPVVEKATLNIQIVDENGSILDDLTTDPQVTITYPNASVGPETVTGGKITIVDTAVGAYSVVLDKTTIPSGYELVANETNSRSVTLADGDNETITYTLKEIPPAPTTGDLKVIILDEDGNKVSFAVDVTAADTTDSTNSVTIPVTNGEATKTDLEPATYAVTIDTANIEANGYELDTSKSGSTIKRDVVAGSESTVTFYVKEKVVTPTTGTLVIEIIDTKNDTKVTFSVDATIANKVSSNGTPVTVQNGEKRETLNVGTYKVTLDEADITAANYEFDTTKTTSNVKDNISITDGGSETVTFYVKEKAAAAIDPELTIEVVDKDGNKVDGAKVTVTYPSLSSTEELIYDGEITIDALPTGDYLLDITTIPDGYILKPDCDKVQNENLVAGDSKTVTYVLLQTAEVKVTVTEEGTDEPIPNAKVEVEIGTDTNGDPVVITGTTDPNGEVTLKLPIGNNAIEITDLPDGYEDPTPSNPMEKVVDVKPLPATNEVPFEVVPPAVTPTGTINVTVTDKTTGDILPGATVELQDGSGNAIKDASNNPIRKVTSNTGEVTFSNLADGTYEVEVVAVPSTYKLPTAVAGDEISVILNGNTVDEKRAVYGTGDIVITVYDKTNGKVVTNAEVTVTGPTGSDYANETQLNTGATGTLTLKDQIVGTYTIKTNGVANYEIYGASNGNVTVSRGQKSEQKFEVVQTADVTVKVTDEKDPTKPIVGAEVTITDPYGNEKTGTTGNDGTVVFPKQPVGQQQVTIDSVPSTSDNVLPDETDKKVTIATGNNGNVEFLLPTLDTTGKGDLVITVVDEKTGAKVPGATVTVKDPQGNEVLNPQGGNEFTTDGDGKIELKDLTPVGNYSVIVNTVPSGYTQPSGTPTKVTVVAGQSTALQVVIKKPVTGGATNNNPPASNNSNTSNNSITKAPKTGDISYIPVAVIVMILSALGFTGVMVYRKKTER